MKLVSLPKSQYLVYQLERVTKYFINIHDIICKKKISMLMIFSDKSDLRLKRVLDSFHSFF